MAAIGLAEVGVPGVVWTRSRGLAEDGKIFCRPRFAVRRPDRPGRLVCTPTLPGAVGRSRREGALRPHLPRPPAGGRSCLPAVAISSI